MGLDQYLAASLYIGGWEHSPEDERKRFAAVLNAAGFPRSAVTDDAPSASLRVDVLYWRKANAIHRWFVEHVQDGNDDCREYYVSRKKLEELRDTCRRALEVAQVSDGQPVHNGTTFRPGQEPEPHFVEGRAILNGSEVAEILPTQGGFFFGSTDYDEWYLRDLERTVKQADRILEALPDCDFYYHSSW